MLSRRLRAVALPAVIAAHLLAVAATAAGFWYSDLRYRRPTPAPAGVRSVPVGSVLRLPPEVPIALDRLTVLHFFNPDCACSRVNAEHMRGLVAMFGDRVSFVAVVEGASTREEAAAEAKRYGLPMPALADPEGDIAHVSGVWSTPQAAIVDATGILRWGGNYNSSRYCTERRTEFARIAIEGLLDPREDGIVARSLDALRAWGCPLPGDLRRL